MVHKEHHGGLTDGRRPGDVMLRSWNGGKHLLVDVAVIDPLICKGCGECLGVCRFDALEAAVPTRVIALACEGCGSCSAACPVDAIKMEDVAGGHWTSSLTSVGTLFHARLFAGMENSGKLVSELRRQAMSFAGESGGELVLIDGPPGIGCPVHAAVTGADLALLVTEPSFSALHDLERALGTVAGFGIPAQVVLNKADLSPPLAVGVREFCQNRNIPLLGEIPFLEEIQEAVETGLPMTSVENLDLQGRLKSIWVALQNLLAEDTAEDAVT